jgi:hypothetical protein
MAGVPVPGYQAFWAKNRATLQAEYKEIKKQYPDAETQYRRLFDILCDIEDVASFTPAAVRESAEWAADDNRINYCKAFSGKTLFRALYGNYTVTLNELKSLAKASTSRTKNPAQEEASKKFEGGNDRAPPSPPRLQRKQRQPSKATLIQRLPPETTSHLLGRQQWTRTLLVPKPLHWRRKPQVKQAGLPR